MNELKKGDQVSTPDGTRATFVRYLGLANKGSSVIQVGLDTRVVASVSLKKVD